MATFKGMLLLFLFFFLSPCSSQNLSDMLAQNPLLAKMAMFSDLGENSTVALPPDPPEDENEDEEDDDLIQRMSTKRSSLRETVSDNFDARYHQMNATMFDQADPEIGDLDYQDSEFPTSPDDVALQNALEMEDVTTSSASFTTSSPFAASSSLFETPMVTSRGFTSSDVSRSTSAVSRSAVTSSELPGAFARTSPYFKAFPRISTSTFMTSTFSTMAPIAFHQNSEDVTSSAPSPSPLMVLSGTTDEDRFFMDAEDVGSTEDVDIDNDVQDISTSSSESSSEDVTTPMTPPSHGFIPSATFQGATWPKLEPLTSSETGIQKRDDENEVVQYNGKYSVSATKYYVDNRVDGEVLEVASPEEIEDTIQENDGDPSTDPFVVEREMRKNVRMHAAKTHIVNDPVKGLEMMMVKDRERRMDDEVVPDKEKLSIETDKIGRKYEARETVYRGQKTTVNLWNQNLYNHDLIRFPGAIFDDRIDEPRRKSDKRRAVASRIVLSSDDIEITPKRVRKVVAGVTTNVKRDKRRKVEDKERKTTEDVESVCFNSKQNTAITRISPFETEDGITKLECLTHCAKTPECSATTYSVPLATCAMYSESLELQKSAIRSQGHSLHRKLSKTTLRCVRMFVSKEFFDSDDAEDAKEEEISAPPFLRLVEKDGLDDQRLPPIFPQQPRCPEGQDVIFVRSDDVEAANHRERREYVEISEDDCVFACLTNSRPGGGTEECTGIEYDKTRGFCFLMTSPPGEMAMTPRAVHPVNTYEKVCIQQQSANKCSGGQPIRHRQKVLIGHLVDAHSVASAAECIDLCIEKHTIGCISVMFYAKESTLNCILNDATNQDDPASFFLETSSIVDFFAIPDCLGIREVNRRNKKRLLQNRIEQRARLRRKMARI